MNSEMRGQLTSLEDIKNFVLAGNATITVRSGSTGSRFTFKVRTPKNAKSPIWFVSLLTGSDNENNYEYFGQIRQNGSFDHGRKSRITNDSTGAKAFRWLWNMVQADRSEVLDQADIWHEGQCGRCGRKLTVPESVSSGFGPECINHI